MEIQDFLIAADQNNQILVKDVKKPAQSMAKSSWHLIIPMNF